MAMNTEVYRLTMHGVGFAYTGCRIILQSYTAIRHINQWDISRCRMV